MRDFIQSYKRLPKRQKIILGLVAIVIGATGPSLMDKFTVLINHPNKVGALWW